MNERVMVIGKGAREHALAYRLSRDAKEKIVREVLVCPGNDGIAFFQNCMRPSFNGSEGIISLARKLKPDLIVIGPEELLAHGLSDALREEGFIVFGPSKKAVQIEASKSFMKELAKASKIPTASFHTFKDEASALEHATLAPYPLVIKADGLCAGKGVVVAQNFEEAKSAIKSHVVSGPIVIEEFLKGVELSVIAICNEDDALLFAPVRDHKRLLAGDKGPNTGGMGVVGPLPEAENLKFMSELKEKFFLPALSYMRDMGRPFRGALFAGLMADGSDVKLLEFNARFGDPETQALMYGIHVDIYPILLAAAKGDSISHFAEDTLMKMQPTACIIVASSGYPTAPRCGDRVDVPKLTADEGIVFFAGVSRDEDGLLITDGGRVATCTASADSLKMAIRKSYDIVSRVTFLGAQYRADIGSTLL